jgi:hypothetical protein
MTSFRDDLSIAATPLEDPVQSSTTERAPSRDPRLAATMKSGFCAHNELLISRLPVGQPGKAFWNILLHLFHEANTSITVKGEQLVSDRNSWENLPTMALESYDKITGVSISRTGLITLLILSNARIIYEFSDSSGYRASFESWTGQWYINWRVGSPAIVMLRPHDSHTPATDVYPPTFLARVNKCVQIMTGVIVHPKQPETLRVAFPGRMSPGRYRLEHQPKGFALSHGARDLYNMNGGKVFEIDFLFPRLLENDRGPLEAEVILQLPSLEPRVLMALHIPISVRNILLFAMDCLPWGNLSWSIHRGMRDILLAVSKVAMDEHRTLLAEQLRQNAIEYQDSLIAAGWEREFVQDYMGDMAASAVLAGRGNSGDAVRIVTALALVSLPSDYYLDETTFWRDVPATVRGPRILTNDTVAALVKCFVLEWSVDFDYQMYHQLPIDLIFS